MSETQCNDLYKRKHGGKCNRLSIGINEVLRLFNVRRNLYFLKHILGESCMCRFAHVCEIRIKK